METRSVVTNYQPKYSLVEEPERQLHPSLNYRIVFDRKSSLDPQIHSTHGADTFPNREQFLETKCRKLQK